MVNFLFSQGISIEKIAAQLSVPIDQIRKNLDQ